MREKEKEKYEKLLYLYLPDIILNVEWSKPLEILIWETIIFVSTGYNIKCWMIQATWNINNIDIFLIKF